MTGDRQSGGWLWPFLWPGTHERSSGEHTVGFSTANEMYPLPDGVSLFLCDGIEADRTGKLYPDGLEPDAKIPVTDTRPVEEKDAVLQAAEQWLT